MPRIFAPSFPLRQPRWRFTTLLLLLALLPLGLLYAALAPKSAPAFPAPPEGFRQLGQTLIGEIRTEDGRRLTLVLDARTRAVIGSRLEATAGENMPSEDQNKP